MAYFSEEDWNTFKQIVLSKQPQAEELFSEYENGHFYIPCNVGLWKRPWFDRYCEFAFEVAGRIEEHYRDNRINREDRYMGYFFENLHTLFIMLHKNDLKTAFFDIEYIMN